MKKIILILFSFCIVFQSCKNEPEEQLENKMFLIPEISNDSILVFGKNNISNYILELYDIKRIFEISELKILETEKLITQDFLNFCKLSNMYLFNEYKTVDFKKLRRQYLYFDDYNERKILLISFWNPSYNSSTKFFFDKIYFKGLPVFTHSFGHLCALTITIDFDKMKIKDVRHW
ncbi:MAG: hypothetical protein IPN09_03290 [Bacteroidetes bacterium]|nr:hypothetical protein [Bacteroidota bacterium]